MSAAYGHCTAAELPTLLAALDAEFVTARGRTLSLAVRYPHLFTPAALAHVHVLRIGGALVACAISRPFTWWLPQRSWSGAMIGMVYTAPAQRGAGHARTLLAHVLATLHAAGTDVAVLWSALEGYYERLGWQRADTGAYGIAHVAGDPPLAAGTDDDEVSAEIVTLRQQASPLVRSAEAWRTLPMPVTRCRLLAERAAYALVGAHGTRNVLYEMHGDERAFRRLWQRAGRGAHEVHVNAAQFGPLYRWLSRHTRIRWQPQRLAFWQPLSAASRQLALDRWYVPYFDRI